MEKDFEANKKGPFMSEAVFRPEETRGLGGRTQNPDPSHYPQSFQTKTLVNGGV